MLLQSGYLLHDLKLLRGSPVSVSAVLMCQLETAQHACRRKEFIKGAASRAGGGSPDFSPSADQLRRRSLYYSAAPASTDRQIFPGGLAMGHVTRTPSPGKWQAPYPVMGMALPCAVATQVSYC